MSLNQGSVQPLEITLFEEAMYNLFNRTGEATNLLSFQGTKQMDTSTNRQKFAITGTTGSPTRKVGDKLPSNFDNCDDSPTFAYSEVDLKWQVAPTRIRYDLLMLKDGYMGDPVEFTLNNLQKDMRFEGERNLCAGIGDDVIFNLLGVVADNGDGTFTYQVANYGGRAGQILGKLMKSLLLEGTPVQSSTAVGQPPGSITPYKILSVVDTLGTESITTAGDITGLGAGVDATGYIVYRSRPSVGGVQGATDAPYGLPYLVSDYTDFATFQSATAATAPRFICEVIRSAAPQAINEDLLNRMLSLGEISLPADPGDGDGPMLDGVFLMNTFNVNAFAMLLLQDRRYTLPPLRSAGASGYAKKYLTFSDLPVAGAHLAQRNSAYYLLCRNLFRRKNGPLWGKFMAIGGQTRFAIPCSPDQEVRWVSCYQNCAHVRPGMVRADNLDAATPDQP